MDIQSTFIISKSKGLLKYFEISTPRHINFAELRKINQTITFHKRICNLTPEVRDILKILWKREEIAPEEQFLLFFIIFCYLLLDFHVKTGTRFSLPDKRLFEISKVEIRTVDCCHISPQQYIMWIFVCVEVLQPSQPNRVTSNAVSLPNHTFTGQA